LVPADQADSASFESAAWGILETGLTSQATTAFASMFRVNLLLRSLTHTLGPPWEEFRESRRRARDTYPGSYFTECILIYEDFRWLPWCRPTGPIGRASKRSWEGASSYVFYSPDSLASGLQLLSLNRYPRFRSCSRRSQRPSWPRRARGNPKSPHILVYEY
jgi:hypothetical protein